VCCVYVEEFFSLNVHDIREWKPRSQSQIYEETVLDWLLLSLYEESEFYQYTL